MKKALSITVLGMILGAVGFAVFWPIGVLGCVVTFAGVAALNHIAA